ncbi:hypothetical protein ASD64_19465 [Mesorhizobium sp. Root157]|nr:hypothetical protein ASD64_19465 [Mesorhizobium sp. Root157]
MHVAAWAWRFASSVAQAWRTPRLLELLAQAIGRVARGRADCKDEPHRLWLNENFAEPIGSRDKE